MWEAYRAEVDKSDARLNEKLLDAVAIKGVHFEMPEDDDWIDEQRFLGVDVPDGRLEMRAHYFRTEVIGGTRDVIRIMALAAGAEVSEEVLARAESSFRDFLQGNLDSGLAGQAGTVEGEPAVDAAPGGG